MSFKETHVEYSSFSKQCAGFPKKVNSVKHVEKYVSKKSSRLSIAEERVLYQKQTSSMDSISESVKNLECSVDSLESKMENFRGDVHANMLLWNTLFSSLKTNILKLKDK